MKRAAPKIRPAGTADIPSLLGLMRELAAFEGYLDDFAVTPRDLRRRGFPRHGAPEFCALVAENAAGDLVGYAVYYLIPFTYDLQPTLCLKELLVRSAARSSGVGRALLGELLAAARRHGCGRIRWAILPGNRRAKHLYRRWGGAPDAQWEYWHRRVDAVAAQARTTGRHSP